MPTPVQQSLQVPEYMVLTRSFFAPNLVEPGAVIRYKGPPGNHLRPLNAAAEAEMEAWYSHEVPEVDPLTKKLTGAMLKPHDGFRRREYTEIELHEAEVLSEPQPDDSSSNIQTLAEIMGASRKSTNQRPGPVIDIPLPPKAE